MATDPQREGRQLHRYRSQITKLKAEVDRLHEIEHQAWHLLDDSAENMTTGEITVMKENYEALSKLLPEGHPELRRADGGKQT